VLVVAEMGGLPTAELTCDQPVFGFHIHGGEVCRGNRDDPFAEAGGHYNPYGCPHPYHAGDLPPLWGADGNAFSAFLTNRFSVDEIIGKTLIVHAGIDDFTSQPAGNAGARMACGEIVGR
jgi:Cu-Zn family superoxide dismutase